MLADVGNFLSGAGLIAALLLSVVLAVGLLLLPAKLAGDKGHSYWGFLVLTIIAFPIALIAALMLTDRATEIAVGSVIRVTRPVEFSDGSRIRKGHHAKVLAMEPATDRTAILITAPDGRNRWIDRAATLPA